MEDYTELASVIQVLARDFASDLCILKVAYDKEAILSHHRTAFRFFKTLETLKAYSVNFAMAATCWFVAAGSP